MIRRRPLMEEEKKTMDDFAEELEASETDPCR